MRLPVSVAAALARRAVRRSGARTAAALLTGSTVLGLADQMSKLILSEARRRIDEGRRSSARRLLSPLASRPPRRPETGLRTAELLSKVGMNAQARQVVNSLLAKADLPAPQRSRLLARLARIDSDASDRAAAAAHLTAALAVAPTGTAWTRTRSRWNHQLAVAEEHAGRWDKAVAAHRAALTDPAAPASWWRHLGRALERTGQPAHAVAAYQSAIAAGDRNPAMHARIARLKRTAPEYIFVSEGDNAYRLDAYPEAAQTGVVAPIEGGTIIGWLPATTTDQDSTVVIKLNGTAVTHALATTVVTLPDGKSYRRFKRGIADLRSFTGEGDILEVERAGRLLPILGSGSRHTVETGQSRSGELIDKLADGYVLNKYGRLQRSLAADHAWQRAIFDLYTSLRSDLRERFGVDLIPFYGTLLGAVREHDFIKVDNDFDTTYISTHSTPSAVRDEFRRICEYLIDRGYTLVVKPTHTRVMPAGEDRKLDIFFGWFNESDELQVSFGYHSTPVKRSDDIFNYRDERLGTLTIPAPANAEAVLEQLYGPGWRVPDPGFKHHSSTRIMPSGHLLEMDQVNELYWRQFYRSNKIEGGSEFAQFVARKLRPGSTVLEFGCGTGHDSIYLAQHGHTVIAADPAPEAIDRAREASLDPDNPSFEVLDVSQRTDLEQFLAGLNKPALASGNLTVYLRFFLHSVTEAVEDALFETLASTLRDGFTLFAEFRTPEDRHLDKVYGEHFRRYIDERQLSDKLKRTWGFRIDHLEAGRGLSPYQGEDPHLARLIARLPRRS